MSSKTSFVCRSCPEPFGFPCQKNLSRHLKEVHGPKEKCPHCDFSFPACRQDNLRRHIEIKHPNERKESKDSEKSKEVPESPLDLTKPEQKKAECSDRPIKDKKRSRSPVRKRSAKGKESSKRTRESPDKETKPKKKRVESPEGEVKQRKRTPSTSSSSSSSSGFTDADGPSIELAPPPGPPDEEYIPAGKDSGPAYEPKQGLARKALEHQLGADPLKAFLGAPSMQTKSDIASLLGYCRRMALSDGHYRTEVEFPSNCIALLKKEEAILPDGTIYRLKTMWVTDPEEEAVRKNKA